MDRRGGARGFREIFLCSVPNLSYAGLSNSRPRRKTRLSSHAGDCRVHPKLLVPSQPARVTLYLEAPDSWKTTSLVCTSNTITLVRESTTATFQ